MLIIFTLHPVTTAGGAGVEGKCMLRSELCRTHVCFHCAQRYASRNWGKGIRVFSGYGSMRKQIVVEWRLLIERMRSNYG